MGYMKALLTLGSRSVEKPVSSPVKVQVPRTDASVPVSSLLFLLPVWPHQLRTRMDRQRPVLNPT